MSVSKEILDWSETRPDWQRDALRRFAIKQAFSPADEEEIAALLKAEHGLAGAAEGKALPLEEKHLREEAGEGGPVQLASVGDVLNANRLAPDQVLHFAIDGLTAVYGDNGSGKSGYVRILKQACRTREADVVLTDVFKAAGGAKPTATVRYRVSPADAVTAETWENGQEFAPGLSQVSVFDSRVASIAVDKENELAFVPFGLDVLDKLAELCSILKERLTGERNAVSQRISDLRQGFGDDQAVVAALDKLSAKTSDKALESLSQWSEADGGRLAAVGLMLSDPVTQAKALRARKLRCDAALAKLREVLGVLGEEAGARLNGFVAEDVAAKAALKILSVETFAAEPLSGVGSDAWRLMYEAARKFSVDYAYSERDFPATDPGDRCVLCHQPLDDEARRRLERFEAFVKEDVDAKAQAASAAVVKAVSALDQGLMKIEAVIEDLARVDPADVEWAAKLDAIAKAFAVRGQALKAAVQDGDWAKVPVAPTVDIVEFGIWPAGLETQAAAHDAALAPEKKAELSAELATLKGRKAFAANKVALTALRDLLARDSGYDKCAKALATNAISQKRKEMDEAHVQGALRAKLKEEVAALRLPRSQLTWASKYPKRRRSTKSCWMVWGLPIR